MKSEIQTFTTFDDGYLPVEMQPDNAVAKGEAYRALSLDLLKSMPGIQQPEMWLEQFYDAVRPSPATFAKEAEAFEFDYYEAKRAQAYIKVCEELSHGDPKIFQELYLDGDSEAKREANGKERYSELCEEISVFSPVSRDQFYDSYEVAPLHEHEEVFHLVLEYSQIERAEEKFAIQSNSILS